MDEPTVTSSLLSHLRRLFPDKLPRSPQSEFEQGRAVGRQDIIDKLQQLHEKEVASHVRAQS